VGFESRARARFRARAYAFRSRDVCDCDLLVEFFFVAKAVAPDEGRTNQPGCGLGLLFNHEGSRFDRCAAIMAIIATTVRYR